MSMAKTFILGVIPARYASTRFQGKPLALIQGVSMIQRVYERCLKSQQLSDICVATDDVRIEKHVKEFGGKVVMTSAEHPSGTDRCLEAAIVFSKQYADNKFPDIVLNIQGDEPLIDPAIIDSLALAFHDSEVEIATPACSFRNLEQVQNRNSVKIVTDVNGNALYFSRSPIPFFRNDQPMLENYLKHIGLYAYKTHVLKEICSLKVSSLEKSESLEQLRWLENGYKIRIVRAQSEGLCVDVPSDIQELEKYMKLNSIQ